MTLIEAVHAALRRMHYSPRTEEAYVHWIRAFVRFHGRRHPREMGAPEIVALLNDLAIERKVAASTANQALCAIVFLYRRVLGVPMPDLDGLQRARRPHHLPAVLGRRDVMALLDQLAPPFRLIAHLLYGSGLRLMEAISLRVKDVDLDRRQIMVRRDKGNHDRPALLPAATRGAHRQAREQPHAPPQLRHRAPRSRDRHPYHPDASRPQGCSDHDDLHAHRRPRPARCHQPARPLTSRAGRVR